MRAEVSRLQQRLDTTTVYVTHDQTEAMTLGDRVAVMRAGMLQQVATPKELYENPVNLFVAGFIGSPAMNFFAGQLEGDAIKTPMGAVPLDDQLRRAPGGRRASAQRGHRRHPARGLRGRRSSRPRATAATSSRPTIELTESMGSEIYAHFGFEGGEAIDAEELARARSRTPAPRDVPGSASGHAVARVDADERRQGGRAHALWLDIEKLHLFDPDDGASMSHGRADASRRRRQRRRAAPEAPSGR